MFMDPGGARFALTPGYLIAAPAALASLLTSVRACGATIPTRRAAFRQTIHPNTSPIKNRSTPAPKITQNAFGRNRISVNIASSMIESPTPE